MNEKQSALPQAIVDAIQSAHPAWHPVLLDGLHAIERASPGYLEDLNKDDYLPSHGRLFAAFTQAPGTVRYVLLGEGPYPRAESATGYCFMDGAVGELWSASGLSKKVNRATSLRNFMKMLLVADGQISALHTSGSALEGVAQRAIQPDSTMINSLAELQTRLHEHGFLLLNATLVFRPHVAPAKESKAWLPFLQVVLKACLAFSRFPAQPVPTLILWGKIAERVATMPEASQFPQALAEHPYNLSFIQNTGMQRLFGPLDLLQKPI